MHGTFKTIVCIILLFGIQLLLASPFIYDPAAHALGFKTGANTSMKEYLNLSKMLGGDPNANNYGADYQWSMYWQTILETSYYHQNFCKTLQYLILAQNVYFFFIRQWCLPDCLSNLFFTFSNKPEIVSQRKQS